MGYKPTITITKKTQQMKAPPMERLPITQQNIGAFLADFPDHQQRYELALSHVAGLNVADVACGAGYGAAMLAKSANKVSGFDIDKATINHANKHFAAANCSFYHADKMSKNGPYDVITSFETLEHMSESDGDEFLKTLLANLKKGGKLILSTPMNEGPHKHNTTPFHVREYSHAELAAKLAANGFTVQEWYGQSNAVTRQINPTMMKSGIHRLVPSPVRQLVKKVMFGDIATKARQDVKLTKADMTSAFVQIAICTKVTGFTFYI